MALAKPKDETHETESVPLLGCEELVRYAIECLRIEDTGRLSPVTGRASPRLQPS
ncbi:MULTISPECIES: hypothetical protein [Mesorhizobium]|uniref:hypothetical protein n=1 Tax=Mesorhizobium australicum TaxID=536018 RepID=UPI00333B9125